MNRWCLVIWVALCCSTVSVLYAQESADSALENDADDRGCIRADEGEQALDAQSGPAEEGSAGNDGLELRDCEEEDSVAAVEDEVMPEAVPPEADTDEIDDEAEIDPEPEFEVDPEDEISEDYPVPLPSDI